MSIVFKGVNYQLVKQWATIELTSSSSSVYQSQAGLELDSFHFHLYLRFFFSVTGIEYGKQ